MAGMHSKKDIDRALNMARRARDRAQRDVASRQQMMAQAVEAVEVTGAALATGYATSRLGRISLLGIPAELLVGGGLQAASLLLGGRYANDLANLGNGILASYTFQLGVGLGAAQQAPGAPARTAGIAGNIGQGGYYGGASGFGYVTPQEIASMAQPFR